ncbi:hypothetical protein [Pseudomonas chlororaphis]|uniref:hypothetical protein n=1 Tax=Pseudomonas chlororaphis TaxID=587753 RepID=UPI001B30497A|nr:hypothetical protein [Pseudomonas chlororaphis]MBP5057600.1 hypothetical protein [Pseudomonas chlororaphis]MBP5140408.1 hypothetical protein [Pseudomonas chlororaphis]QTT99116.1 hypothetical protein HUT26_07490 [Pseudomonas chlororaphis]
MTISKFIPCPMATLISMVDELASDTGSSAFSYGVGSAPGQATEQSVSEHYNSMCSGTFASVLGLDHQQLVDDAVVEKAMTSPPLH